MDLRVCKSDFAVVAKPCLMEMCSEVQFVVNFCFVSFFCSHHEERVDLILLMFDAHKLDIGDEFRRCIQSLKGNDSKIRIVLNKADLISPQQLMRVCR